jgi:uncharacterized protein
MNAVILYSQNIETDGFIDAFRQLQINPLSYCIKDSWEDDQAFLDIVTSNEFFFIITTKDIFEEKWFKFVIGYCLGKECSLFLFLNEPVFRIPEHLSFINFGSTLEQMSSFYRESFISWKKKNDLKEVKNKISEMGLYLTPYHFFNCIEKKDIEAVTLYLKADFNPDTRNEKGATAFNYAIRLGYNEIAKLLMKYNCDIFAVSLDSGNNAIMDASANKNFEMAKILIDKGIDLNVQSKNDQTALMLAVGRNDEKTVELLLQSGADTKIKDVIDMTAFMYAEILKYKNILKLLEKYKK